MLDTGIDQKIYIKKGAAYLSGAYTAPKYRGRKLAHKTILKACDEFIKGGGKTIKLVNNVGFKEYPRVQYVKIAFFRFYIFKSPGKLCRFLKISKSSDKTFNQKLFVDVM